MIFSIVDEPPSWSDVDDSLEDDMPEHEDFSSHSGVGDEEVPAREGEGKEEEDSDGDFFDAGEGAVINGQVSPSSTSGGGQGERDAEDDLVGYR